jgi:competence protein ComEA
VDKSTRLAWILGILTGVVGVWGLWPHLAPRAVGIPQVVRQNFVETAPVGNTLKATGSESDSKSTGSKSTGSKSTGSSVQAFVPDKVNVNTATLEQIVALPSVGPTLAQRIVDGRPYQALADLDKVKGIGPKLLEKLAPVVIFK